MWVENQMSQRDNGPFILLSTTAKSILRNWLVEIQFKWNAPLVNNRYTTATTNYQLKSVRAGAVTPNPMYNGTKVDNNTKELL